MYVRIGNLYNVFWEPVNCCSLCLSLCLVWVIVINQTCQIVGSFAVFCGGFAVF